jgi:glycosyltransferase involved in cell wall biosynthesis
VGDVKEAYARAAVVINPVLAGTGLKTKTIEALAFGCPLVSTSCGAEGLEAAAGSAFYLADDPVPFAAAVIELLTDPERAAGFAKGALQFVEQWNSEQMRALNEVLSTHHENQSREPHSPHLSPQSVAEVRDVRGGPGKKFAPV